ncbi:MAG: hypothetical protein ACK5MK_01075 [Dysgonomonas sp.]
MNNAIVSNLVADDQLSFNASLAESQISNHVAIAFNPSYISKSGNTLPTWVVSSQAAPR